MTLHSTPGIHATADAFFDPLDRQLNAVMDRYEPELLDRFTELLGELHEAMRGYRPGSE